MESRDYLDHLRRELDAFEACLDGDLSAPVEQCGDWTVYDLAEHLGSGNRWAAAAVTEKRGDRRPPGPDDPADLVPWFRAGAADLLTTLDTDPATAAWSFFPPHTVGFWQRRRTLEALVHRWDAEHALGQSSTIDPALAADAVAEVLDTFVPLQLRRGRLSPQERAVGLRATDAETSWQLGPGEPVATAAGTAAHLMLLLWHRLDPEDPAITWNGDHLAGRAVLAGPIVS
jgi:uncharacterized protein (TIGR03083 family)